MCTELLTPGGYPTAINKYITSCHIKYTCEIIHRITMAKAALKNKKKNFLSAN
jgi:hypothetical protein